MSTIRPDHYKMICKSRTTGKVVERDYLFTENSFTSTITITITITQT